MMWPKPRTLPMREPNSTTPSERSTCLPGTMLGFGQWQHERLSHAGKEVYPQQWYAMGYAGPPFCPDSIAMDTTSSDFGAGGQGHENRSTTDDQGVGPKVRWKVEARHQAKTPPPTNKLEFTVEWTSRKGPGHWLKRTPPEIAKQSKAPTPRVTLVI